MSPINEGAACRRTRKTISAPPRRGFTLVELLVSMTVLLLVMVLTVQLVGRTTSITTASNKLVDVSTMARTVFDRLGEDLLGASFTGGQTALYYSGSTGTTIDTTANSALGFVCKTRARKVSSTGTSDPNQDVRGIVVAYKIRTIAVTTRPGNTVNIPLIHRGDAEFTYSKTGSQGSNGAYGFSVWDMFGSAGTYPLPNDLTKTPTTNDTKLLAWNGFGDGILRFHISFVLDDGRIVQNLNGTSNGVTINATYKNFQANGPIIDASHPNGPTGDCQPIAFSAATSVDKNKRYVTGMIVGVVALDQNSLNFAYAQDAQFDVTLTNALKRPANDGETPLGVWQASLDAMNSGATPTTIPLPVRRSLRFYQRFYAINL